jgi:hypothetical protein
MGSTKGNDRRTCLTKNGKFTLLPASLVYVGFRWHRIRLTEILKQIEERIANELCQRKPQLSSQARDELSPHLTELAEYITFQVYIEFPNSHWEHSRVRVRVHRSLSRTASDLPIGMPNALISWPRLHTSLADCLPWSDSDDPSAVSDQLGQILVRW